MPKNTSHWPERLAPSEQLRSTTQNGRDFDAQTQTQKVEPVAPVGEDPIWSLPPDDPRLRYALMVESYPEGLRERLVTLGSGFATAAFKPIRRSPESQPSARLHFVEKDDVVRFERARASIAAGASFCGIRPDAVSATRLVINASGITTQPS